jgi:hypothetical protein
MFAAFDAAAEEVRTQHLPNVVEDAIRYYRSLIDQHHAAILILNFAEARNLHGEAHDLAVKLNAGEPGILAHREAPAYVLQHATQAPPGSVPLWGQTGNFIVEPQPDLRVRIEMDGIFGIAADPIPGFSAHVVEPQKRFISPTGYRSFLGLDLSTPGTAVDGFVCEAIRAYIRDSLNGRLLRLDEPYRSRCTSTE